MEQTNNSHYYLIARIHGGYLTLHHGYCLRKSENGSILQTVSSMTNVLRDAIAFISKDDAEKEINEIYVNPKHSKKYKFKQLKYDRDDLILIKLSKEEYFLAKLKNYIYRKGDTYGVD